MQVAKKIDINNPVELTTARFPNTGHQVTPGDGGIPLAKELGLHTMLQVHDQDFFGDIVGDYNAADATVNLTNNFDANQIVFSTNDEENLAMIQKYDVPRQFGWGFTDNRLHPSLIEKFRSLGRPDLLAKYYGRSSMSLYEREVKVRICDIVVDTAGFREVEDFKVQNKFGEQDKCANTLAGIMSKMEDNKLHEVSFEAIKFVENLLENDIAMDNAEFGLKILTGLVKHPDRSIGSFIISLAGRVDYYNNASLNATADAWILAKKEFCASPSQIAEELLTINRTGLDIKTEQSIAPALPTTRNDEQLSRNNKFIIFVMLIAILLGLKYNLS